MDDITEITYFRRKIAVVAVVEADVVDEALALEVD